MTDCKEKTRSFHRLDSDTGFETVLEWIAKGGMLLTLIVFGFGFEYMLQSNCNARLIATFRAMCFITWMIMAMRGFVDCTYLIDKSTSTLLYARSILFFTKVWSVCPLTDIKATGVCSKSKRERRRVYHWYAVALKLPGNVGIPVSRYSWSLDKINREAEYVNSLIGSEFVPCNEGGFSVQIDFLNTPELKPVDVKYSRPPIVSLGIYRLFVFVTWTIFTIAAHDIDSVANAIQWISTSIR